MNFAQRMRARYADMSVDHAGKTMGVTLSLGLALLMPEENPAHAIGRNDDVLYLSKSAGRNGVTLASTPQIDVAQTAGSKACPV